MSIFLYNNFTIKEGGGLTENCITFIFGFHVIIQRLVHSIFFTNYKLRPYHSQKNAQRSLGAFLDVEMTLQKILRKV